MISDTPTITAQHVFNLRTIEGRTYTVQRILRILPGTTILAGGKLPTKRTKC